MNIYFVMGLPHSGKSTYVDQHFDVNNVLVVDVLDNEVKYDDYSKAMLKTRLCLDVALSQARKENKDVVFEFPGLTINQRQYFIKRVNIVKKKDDKFIAVWTETDDQDLYKRIKMNGKKDGIQIIEQMKDMTIKPTVQEGFDKIIIEHNENKCFDQEIYIFSQAKYHCQYNGNSLDEAIDLLEQYYKGAINDSKETRKK